MGFLEEGSLSFQSDAESYSKKADFENPTYTILGVSTKIRPDALSFDHLVAFSAGPVAYGDTSLGLLNKAWYVRYDVYNFYLARELNGEWEAETILFTMTGQDNVKEIDLAFTQNAEALVTVERNGEVWLYWFKPSAGTHVFEKICDGRTPRVLLDDPVITDNSDVQIFYIDDLTDTVKRREQRSLYNTVYDTPVEDTQNKYLEDIYFSVGHRLYILFSIHDVAGKTWRLDKVATTLFPIRIEPEEMTMSALIVSGALTSFIIFKQLSPEEMDLRASVVSGLVEQFLTTYSASGEISGALSITSFSVLTVLLIQTLPAEEMDLNASMVSGSLVVVVITGLIDPEAMDLNASVISGSLAVFP